MAIIKPFAATRPRADVAARVCELPYDVLSSEEARALAAGNPLSFLRVSKPEIDLPPGTDPHAPEVYARGRENFQRLLADGVLRRDATPAFHVYRLTMSGHTQTGLVAVAGCEEYLRGVIKKHELTRTDKEDDRVRHIEALNAQTGPAFLTCRATPALEELLARRASGAPEIDFTAPDGVRHSAWTIADAATIARVEEEFARIPGLYIADGHHRSAAAARVYRSRGGAGQSGFFLAVIFPHDQLQVLPYNRVLKDLRGHTPESLLTRLETVFEVETPGRARPHGAGEVGLYLAGRWHTLRFRGADAAAGDPAARLDVTRLQERALRPVFGIENPRTSERLGFVGGVRGSGELERLVDSGIWACAFAMYPTCIEDLMAIADAGGLMPPKSTWFEPKLRDGMFCHLLG